MGTGLWMIPLVPEAEQDTPTESVRQDANQQQANHLHQSSTKAETAEFYHQSLFSPPPTTLLKAIKNNQFDSFPGLVPSLLKHLPPSTATAKGHMPKNRKGIRSTRAKTKEIQDARLDLEDMDPPQQICSAQDHCFPC